VETATILKLLGQVRIFEGFGPGDLKDFLAQTVGCTYAAGEDIFTEGEPGRDMHIILTGKVEVYRRSAGLKVPLVKLGSGESFGEMSLVQDAQAGRTASIRAVENTATLRIDHDSLTHIPGVASKLYRNIARTLATRLKISTDLVMFQVQYGGDVPPAATLSRPRRKAALRTAGG
jgi:CRP-like cAMP-binding protein